jgi:thiol-disulfide isomerase/thioredoxin
MTATKTRPQPRRRGSARGRKPTTPPLLIGIVVAVALLLGAAFLLTGGDEDADAGPQTADVTIDGQPLPTFADPQSDPAVGLPAPRVEGVDFAGAPVAITPGERPLVVLFAAHWCGFCQQEVAELSPWLAEGGAAQYGVDVVAVSTGVDPRAANYPPSTWFEREGWPNAVVVDSDARAAASAYGLSGYPFFAFVDADGTVVGRTSGAMGLGAFEALLEQLSAG